MLFVTVFVTIEIEEASVGMREFHVRSYISRISLTFDFGLVIRKLIQYIFIFFGETYPI